MAGQLQTLLTEIQNIDSNTQSQISASGGIVSQSQLNGMEKSQLNSFSSQQAQLNNQLEPLKEQANQLSSEINSANSEVNTDCHNLGIAEKNQQYQTILGSQKNLNQTSPSTTTTTTNTTPQAMSSLEKCISMWGAHTHPSNDTSSAFTKVSGCACDTGYVWTHYTDKTIDKCVAVNNKNSVSTSTPPTTATAITTTPTTSPKQKHWYDWLNPFTWFKI